MRLGVGVLAIAASFVVAAGARAQVLPPPSETVFAPEGEATAYGANPSRTGTASEEWVFGPLKQVWTREFDGRTYQPLVVDGRVLIEEQGSLNALDPDDGKVLWSQSTPGPYDEVWLAADAGRVLSVASDGEVRAFEISDGTPAWSRPSSDFRDTGGPPIASDGVLYFAEQGGLAGAGHIDALSIADGGTLWSQDVIPRVAGQFASFLAIDSARIFIVGFCGDAEALQRSNGVSAWVSSLEDSCDQGNAFVSGGLLFNSAGLTRDATNGAEVGSLDTSSLRAVDDDLAFELTEYHIRAVPVSEGASGWEKAYQAPCCDPEPLTWPLVVGGTVYVANDYYLDGRERSTGRLLFRAVPPSPGRDGFSATQGLAAGERTLYLSHGQRVTAYRPYLRPERDGVDAMVSHLDVWAGSRTRVVGGVGPDLRTSMPRMDIEADPFPYGHMESVAHDRVFEDGTRYFKPRVRRNTRFRMSSGDAHSDPFTVYAYPRYHLQLGGWTYTHGVANAKIKRVPAHDLSGRPLIVYFGSHETRRWRRIAAGTLHATGPQSAKASVRFPIPRGAGRHDLIAVCAKGLPEDGYGRDISLIGHCGNRFVSYKAKASAKAAKRADADLGGTLLPSGTVAPSMHRSPAAPPEAPVVQRASR